MGCDGPCPSCRSDAFWTLDTPPRKAVGRAGTSSPASTRPLPTLGGLPTTPFLLLAAVCYARSSKRFYDWLMANRWCGAYIRNYREGRGITLRQKALTISLLWLTIGYTVWFVLSLWWVKLILLGVAGGVTFHLIRMKTLKPE